MIASLVAGLVLALGQDTPRDYKFPVMPIWQFGQWLEKETGRQVTILPQVQDRLVYINVKNRTLPELLGFLKQAVGVGVLDKNGTLTLTDERTLGNEGRYQKEDLDFQMSKWKLDEVSAAQYEEGINKTLEFQNRQQRPGYRFDMKDYEENRQFQGFEPTARALRRIVLAMGSNAFMQLPEKQRIVFSTRPTSLQKQWIGNSAAEMTRMTKAMQLRNEVLERVKKPEEDSDMRYFFDSAQLAQKQGGNERPVAAMLLVATRDYYGIMVSLRTFDARGKLISKASDQLSGYDQSMYSEIETKITKFFENDKQEITFDDSDKIEMRRLMGMRGYSGDRESMTPEDLEWISQIDVNEPFAGLVTRVFDFAATSLNIEVVREIVTEPSFYSIPKSMSVKDAATGLISSDIYAEGLQLQRDTLMIGKPAPTWYYENMVPRRAIASIAQHIRSKGRYTFDELADSVASLPHRNQIQQFFSTAMSLSTQGGDYAYLEQLDWSEFMLLAYASLTPQQRKQVFTEAGLKIGLNQLTKRSQDYFWETVRHAEFNIGQGYDFGNDEYVPDYAEMGMVPKGYEATDWNLEQTYFMSLPASQPIMLEFKSSARDGLYAQQTFKSDDGEEFRYGQFQDLEEFARNSVIAEMAEAQGANYYGKPNSVSMATEQRMTMQVRFGGFNPPEEQLAIFKDPRKDTGDISQLPEDIRKKLEELKAKFRIEYKDIQFGSPGGSGNPPPP